MAAFPRVTSARSSDRPPEAVRPSQPSESNEPAATTSCGRQTSDTHRRRRRSCPKTDDRSLTAGVEDTFPRFSAFRRNQMHRSLRAGLPPQRHPLSGFLTLPAVSSRCTLVAVFQATSTHRLDGSSELLPPQSAVMPLGIRCSLAIRHSRTQIERVDCVCDVRTLPPENRMACARHRRRPWLQSFPPTGRPTLCTTGERRTEPLLS
jgi:hypothetical protein